MNTELNFGADYMDQPYRTRNGEFAVVESREGDHWNGWLLPSGLTNAWDRLGNDLDGHRQYDLMHTCGANTPDARRFRQEVRRLLKK